MTKSKFNRRSWLTRASMLLAGPPTMLFGAGGFARAETATSLTKRLKPLKAGDRHPVITSMAVDPQGEILAVAGDDASIRILDAATLAESAQLTLHRDNVRALTFRPDGNILASGGNDGTILLWDRRKEWSTAGRVDELPTLFCARFSPDGRHLAAVGFDSRLMIFGTGAPQLQCRCADLRAVAYHDSGKRLTVVGRNGVLYLFDPIAGGEIGQFPIHTSRVRDVVILPESNRAATVAEDGAVTIFDYDGYRIVKRINFLPCKLFAIAAIDATTIAVAGSDNRIRIVDCQDGEVIRHLDGHDGSVSSLVFTEGKLYSGGYDATVRKWAVGNRGDRVAERDRMEEGKR